MSSAIAVTVHSSEFPQSERDALIECFRRRRIAPKFLYQSHRQAQLWQAVHRAHSPAWLDPDCAAIYDQSFEAAAGIKSTRPVRVIGLGCGNGHKEARLLRALRAAGKTIAGYAPCDVSVPLVVMSAQAAAESVPGARCDPLVCDLSSASDLPGYFEQAFEPAEQRIFTFFGMIPNFEPDAILPKLSGLLRPGDALLFSANLAPGKGYRAGVERVLPGYDNVETRAWLMSFLIEHGVGPGNGAIEFSLEDVAGLWRIVADFRFKTKCSIAVFEEPFVFAPGDVMRLFFSYRYTPDRIGNLLRANRLETSGQCITASEEEAVFMCARAENR